MINLPQEKKCKATAQIAHLPVPQADLQFTHPQITKELFLPNTQILCILGF